MKNESALFIAKLSGIEKIEFYLKNLKSNPSFSFTVTKQEDTTSVEITGPRKELENESLNDIRTQFSRRAHELGIHAPKLVESAGRDILNAQKAEEIVLAGEIQLVAMAGTKADSVSVTLYVALDDNPKVDEIIDQYALLRITWLANALGMNFETFEKKAIQLH